MASFPELLYVPAASDIAKAITVPQRFAWDVDITANQAVIAATSVTVPKDRVLRLTRYSAYVKPDPGTGMTLFEIFAQNEIATFAHFIGQHLPRAPVPPEEVYNEDIDVTLMPGERIQHRTTYIAALANNRIICTVWGWMYPRANIQHSPV